MNFNRLVIRVKKRTQEMENQGAKGLLFLTTILSKMSQMFSELNFIYVNSMMNQQNVEIAEEYTTNTLIQEEKQKMEKEKVEKQQEDAKQLVENKQKEEELQVPWLDQYDIEKKKQHLVTDANTISQQKIIEEDKKPQKIKKNPEIEKITRNMDETSYITPPQPPPSSFILFLRDNRDKIAKAYPGISRGQLSKIASNCWKCLTAEQKSIYHDQFNILKKKYHEQMKQYNRKREIIEGIREAKQIKKGKGSKRIKVPKQNKKVKPEIPQQIQPKPKETKKSKSNSDSDSI